MLRYAYYVLGGEDKHMSDRIDALLAQLKTRSIDRSLANLEQDISRNIELQRTEARTVTVLMPLRAASLALALVVGTTAGGAVALSSEIRDHAEPFDSSLRLAPSSLLEGYP
ncbi:hypothetical protein ABAC460_17720 [Asticcacaulis sp. AC460]|nr:hypothetical protein ABAC460_17720 [Asticcacaulis sp. AC460]